MKKSLRLIFCVGWLAVLSFSALSAQEQAETADAVEVEVAGYWKKVDFKKISLIPLEEKMEKFIMDYLKLLNQLPLDRAASHIQEMMHSAAVDSTGFARFVEIYETFLTDRSSPVCNEELMKEVLKKVLEESVFSDIDKVRPTMLLELLSKNSVGMKAADFDCKFRNGSVRKMMEVESEYLLLFFYDPDCDHCEAAISALSGSTVVTGLIQSGKLKILAVYPNEDMEAWNTYATHLPDSWLNACNASLKIRDEELYDLMDTPAIYLLDREHKVIRKNILPGKVVDILQEVIK